LFKTRNYAKVVNLAEHQLYRVKGIDLLEINTSLLNRIQETYNAFNYIINKGYDKWLITFSGGKDSTLTLILAIEYALKNRDCVKSIDIVYSDTLIEISSIHQFAMDFLKYINESDRISDLPITTHIVTPKIEDRFWVKVLGNGYPPPHQKFRWCTRRLKIEPCNEILKEIIVPNETAVLTGVRFGESNSRNQRLNASCARGGECGQGLWFERSNKLNIGYLAPIINWPLCDVWDYLCGFAPIYEYPTHTLKSVYNGHDTRFGCWMCTVVRQDKAMARTIEQYKWSHLKPLYEFRNYLWESTRLKETRVLNKNGHIGKLKIKVRKELLKKLLTIEASTKVKIINEREIGYIKKLWTKEIK
jgi:DNA sulfur modification protein DndC